MNTKKYMYPKITPVPTANRYTLAEDFFYNDHGYNILIKAGFIFDGASIPRAFWFSTGNPYTPSYIRAALLHDYAYITHILNRQTADKLFYIVLRDDGVSWYQAKKMYYAVKTFGFLAYKKGGN